MDFNVYKATMGLLMMEPGIKLGYGNSMNHDVLLFGAAAIVFASEFRRCEKAYHFRGHARRCRAADERRYLGGPVAGFFKKLTSCCLSK